MSVLDQLDRSSLYRLPSHCAIRVAIIGQLGFVYDGETLFLRLYTNNGSISSSKSYEYQRQAKYRSIARWRARNPDKIRAYARKAAQKAQAAHA